MNVIATGMFAVFVVVTLAITVRVAARARSAAGFYAAEGRFSGSLNGLAISGDFMSAATFLGVTGLLFTTGVDTGFYVAAPLLGLAILMFVMAGPFRKLGRFTLTDVLAVRLAERPVRIFAALTSLVVVVFYLIPQFVGAGKLVQALLGVPFITAVVFAGTLTMIYVAVGGMIATTWVQIIKATLMIFAITLLTIWVLWKYDFSLGALYDAAAATPMPTDVFVVGNLFPDSFSLISFCVAIPLGTAGLPHILMRLYTVPDDRQASLSVMWATLWISAAFIMILVVVGFGAIPILAEHPEFFTEAGTLDGGSNMVALYLTQALGGDVFFGFVAAVVFATILAVVCGLILAGASAFSHDLYSRAIRQGKGSERTEMIVTRVATVVLGVTGISLALVFENQNIAFMVTIAFAVSASTNFPALILALFWRGLTTRGLLVGGGLGLLSTLLLVVTGPIVWVDVLGNETAIFPYAYPGLITCPTAFVGMWLFSKLDRSARAVEDRNLYDEHVADVIA